MPDQKRLTREDLLLAAKHFAVLAVAYDRGEDFHGRAAFEERARAWARDARKDRSGLIAAAREMEGLFRRATKGELDWPGLHEETRRTLEAWTGSCSTAEVDAVLTYDGHLPKRERAEIAQHEETLKREVREVKSQHPENVDADVLALANFRLVVKATEGPAQAARTLTLCVLEEGLGTKQAQNLVRDAHEAVEFGINVRGHHVEITDVHAFVRDLWETVDKEAEYVVCERGIPSA